MKQMIFYSTTEAELFDWSITERSLADIQNTGFDSVYLEYRNVRATARSPRFQVWLTRFCQHCEKIGMEVAVDAHVNAISAQLQERHPEAYTDPLQYGYHTVEQGQFELKTTGEPLHWGVEKAYLITRGGPDTLASVEDVTDRLRQVHIQVEGGGCAMTEARGPSVATRRFEVEGVSAGELMLIERHRFTYAARDVGHPAVLGVLPELLEMMGGETRPCAGFMWDEPHFGFAFFPNNGRAISDHLYARFESRFGYDLRGRLIELWWNVEGRQSALVRLHYAELLEGELAILEERFAALTQAYCRERTGGRSGFLGMHRTMHEELSDDFYIGCSDYFRHNKHTSSGFTDSVFERDDSMLMFFRLAQSLGLDSSDGHAWSNNWGFRPTEAHHNYYLPLMGIMNVRWIGHTYHDSIQFGPGYPDSDLWANMPDHLADHSKLMDALEGTCPVADTAVVYNWKALALYPDNYIHTHRRSLLLLSKQLARQGTQFLFIDDLMLAEATVEADGFATRIGTFKRLILPWCDLLDPGAFEVIERLAAAGVEIVCFGAPAEYTSDGQPVRERFQKLIGASVGGAVRVAPGTALTFEQHDYAFAPERIQPNFDSNPVSTYPDHYKIYPVDPVSGQGEIGACGELSVVSRKGTVQYLGFDFPHCPGMVEALLPKPEIRFPKGAILMRSADKETEWAGLCGEFGAPLHGVFEWGGTQVELNGDRYALFSQKAGELLRIC